MFINQQLRTSDIMKTVDAAMMVLAKARKRNCMRLLKNFTDVPLKAFHDYESGRRKMPKAVAIATLQADRCIPALQKPDFALRSLSDAELELALAANRLATRRSRKRTAEAMHLYEVEAERRRAERTRRLSRKAARRRAAAKARHMKEERRADRAAMLQALKLPHCSR